MQTHILNKLMNQNNLFELWHHKMKSLLCPGGILKCFMGLKRSRNMLNASLNLYSHDMTYSYSSTFIFFCRFTFCHQTVPDIWTLHFLDDESTARINGAGSARCRRPPRVSQLKFLVEDTGAPSAFFLSLSSSSRLRRHSYQVHMHPGLNYK